MEKFFAIVVGLALGGALALAFFWVIHSLWCWVLPQLWPSGPTVLIQPSYWLFVGAWVLATLVGGAVFKSEGSKS